MNWNENRPRAHKLEEHGLGKPLGVHRLQNFAKRTSKFN